MTVEAVMLIALCEDYRRKATPLGPTWDEQDRASYFWYLDKCVARLAALPTAPAGDTCPGEPSGGAMQGASGPSVNGTGS